MKRQLLSLMLMLASFTAFAYDFESNGIYYDILEDGTCEVTSNTAEKYTGSVVIPSEVCYDGKVYNVTSIGYRAFYNCSGLTNIAIPNSVTSIGQEAFYGCGISIINIPNGVTAIERGTFRSCASLAHVTIPESMTSIGGLAFDGCSNLVSVRCFAKEPPTCPVGLSGAFPTVSANSSTPVTLIVEESSVAAYSAATVWKNFANIKPLVKEPMTGKCGPNATFTYDMMSGLLSVSGTGEIKDNLYPKTWTNMKTDVVDLVIEEGITEIGTDAFPFTFVQNIVLPTSVKSIRCFGFDTGIGCITIPSSISSIERFAFYTNYNNKKVGKVVIACRDESDLRNYLQRPDIYNVFRDYNTTGLNASSWTISVGGGEVTDIAIPEGVTSIATDAFGGFRNLESIIIPGSVTEIGNTAFGGCYSLTSITSYAMVPPACGYNVFVGISSSKVVLKVPASAVEAYKSADQWKNFTIEAISDNETLISVPVADQAEKIYTLDGKLTNRASMKKGNVYIIKTGNRSVKYQF